MVALIFLILLTILALSASSGSLLQMRMAGNLRSAQQARMAADTALRGAEYMLWSKASVVGARLLCVDGDISQSPARCVIHNTKTTDNYGANGAITHFRTGKVGVGGIGIQYKGPEGSGYTSYSAGDDMETAKLHADPSYIIEDLGRMRPPGAGVQQESGAPANPGSPGGAVDIHVYRITARAAGGGSNNISVVQSVFDAQTTN